MHSEDTDHELLLELTQEVTRISRELAQLPAMLNSTGGEPDGTHLLISSNASPRAVKSLIGARQKRAHYLPETLFAEPAWDMLLDLLRAELSEQPITISSLCIAAGVPPTTALRWIQRMVEMGVLVRHSDTCDRRRAFIELAPKTSKALHRYFSEVIEEAGRAATA
jgi:hypothetical protein